MKGIWDRKTEQNWLEEEEPTEANWQRELD